jgi:hypothetical protein
MRRKEKQRNLHQQKTDRENESFGIDIIFDCFH